MKNRLFLLLAFLFGLSFSSLAQDVERGIASYYSKRLSGRRTSNGGYYDPNAFTCAHKKHPFGTKLRVYWPKTGKEVIVRVTDRGPFGKGFIVDLSYAAAKKLGILSAGIAQVEVTVADGQTPVSVADSKSCDTTSNASVSTSCDTASNASLSTSNGAAANATVSSRSSAKPKYQSRRSKSSKKRSSKSSGKRISKAKTA